MERRTLGLMTAALVTAGCGAAEAELIPAATLPAVEVDLEDSNNVDPVETSNSIMTSTTVGSVVLERFLEEDPSEETTTTTTSSDPHLPPTNVITAIDEPATVYKQAERVGNQSQVGTTIAPPTTVGENCRPVQVVDPVTGGIINIIVCD